MIGVDAEGVIVLINAQAERLFGYPRDELVGQKIEILIPQGARGIHPSRRAGYVADPRSRPMGAGMDLAGRRKDGTEFPVEISLSAIETEDGVVVSAAVRDVTERKRAEARFRGLLEAAPDAIVGVDAHGVIVLINAQAERLFGYPRDELVGQKIEMLVPLGVRQAHPNRRAGYVADPRPRLMGAGMDLSGRELAGRRRDGSEFPAEIALSAFVTEDGIVVSASVRDVTERRRIEQELRDKNAELVKVGRTKDTFLASMSHELRTPLNAIIGFTGTLLMELPGPLNEAQHRQLRIVENSGKHLLSIINDLLDLAKIESTAVQLALESVDCTDVIEGVMASLQVLAADKGLEFTAKLPPQRLIVRSNTRALGQILINLVSNAIKFTDAGHVLVELRVGHNGDGPTITVNDSGPGIAEEDLGHLFNAFERGSASAASSTEGTGLGLHISRKISEIIGAEITVKSIVGSGTTFAVALKDQR
jgi:PAS domain S-box-containing protein